MKSRHLLTQNPSNYFSSSCCSLHAGRTDSVLLGQHRSDPSEWLARDAAFALGLSSPRNNYLLAGI